MAGSPIVASASSAEASRAAWVAPSTMELGRVRLADPVEQVAERLAVLGHPDRLERRAEQADRVALEDARVGHRGRQVERGLAAEAGQQPLGLLPGDDRLDRLDGQRLEVDDVGDRRVGHDRRRVRVDEDRADALGSEGAAGLRPGVVELGRLADDDRAPTRGSGPTRASGPVASCRAPAARSPRPRTGRTPPARRAAPARPRGGTGPSRSASSRGAAPRPSRRSG